MVKSNQIFKNPPAATAGVFYFRQILAGLLFFFSFNTFSQAKLEITEAKKNFGFVKRGEIIKNEYEVTNTGNTPLLLTEVEISCSCTTAEFSKQPIPPGQKVKVLVIFNTTTVYGRQDRVVLLHSTDASSPHKLRYKGTVSME